MAHRKWRLPVAGTIVLTVATGAMVLDMHPASAGSASSPASETAPLCSAAVAQAAAPTGVRVGPINDLNGNLPAAPTGALLMPVKGNTSAYCLVTGSVITNESTGKTANFGIALPLNWNRKFLFSGCGGYCEVVFQNPPDAHGGGYPTDALAKGYAIVKGAIMMTESGPANVVIYALSIVMRLSETHGRVAS